MKEVLLLINLVVCLTQVEAQCRDGWLTFRSNCYLFSRDTAPWGESGAICRTFHSHLAIVESADEHSFLKSELIRLHGSGSPHWLDGTDIEVENVWRWAYTGERITYHKWAPNEPYNGHGSNCMSLNGHLSFDMAGDVCTKSFNYICEMRSVQASAIIG